MDTLEKLVEAFKKFPGIGPRQARRFAYHLLNEERTDVAELGKLIQDLRAGIASCEKCFRFFAQKNRTESAVNLCTQCIDQNRDQTMLMIVTTDTDINAVEQRKMFPGLYFVMGKNAELASADTSTLPRLSELKKQITEGMRPNLKEIILAMNANTEGEHTSEIIKSFLKKNVLTVAPYDKVRITMLGRGLSTGTELEYSDTDTLKSALENRRMV